MIAKIIQSLHYVKIHSYVEQQQIFEYDQYS